MVRHAARAALLLSINDLRRAIRPRCSLGTRGPVHARLCLRTRLAHFWPPATFAATASPALNTALTPALKSAPALAAAPVRLRLSELLLLALFPALEPPLPVLGRQTAHAFALAAPRAREFGVVRLPFPPPVAPIIERLAPILPAVEAIIAPVSAAVEPIVAPVIATVEPIVATVPATLLLVLPALLRPIAAMPVLHRKAPAAGAIEDPCAIARIIKIVPIAAAIADLAKAIASIAAVPAVPCGIAVAIGVKPACKAVADADRDAAITAVIAINACRERNRSQRQSGNPHCTAASMGKKVRSSHNIIPKVAASRARQAAGAMPRSFVHTNRFLN